MYVGLAHDYADVYGDMIGVFQWNVSNYATEWFIPTIDVHNIYISYYGDLNQVKTIVIKFFPVWLPHSLFKSCFRAILKTSLLPHRAKITEIYIVIVL